MRAVPQDSCVEFKIRPQGGREEGVVGAEVLFQKLQFSTKFARNRSSGRKFGPRAYLYPPHYAIGRSHLHPAVFLFLF